MERCEAASANYWGTSASVSLRTVLVGHRNSATNRYRELFLMHTHTLTGTLKMRDMKQRERKQRHQNVPKFRGGNCEKRKLAQCCSGWKMRDMNIRESRWLLNPSRPKHGQRLQANVDSVRLTTEPLNQSVINRVGPLPATI